MKGRRVFGERDESAEQADAEELGDLFGIGFGGGEFHDLAGEEIEEFFVSGFDGIDFFGIGGDGLIDEGFERAGVGFLEAEFGGDGGGIFGGRIVEDGENFVGLV